MAAALLLACACEPNGTEPGKGEPIEPPPTKPAAGPPATVRPLSALSNIGFVGDSTTMRPSIVVLDANGAAVPNVPVTYTLSADGGRLYAASPSTDAGGIATVRWALPTKPAQVTLDVAVANVAPVRFLVFVNAEPASAIEVLSGNDQAVAAGASATLRVRMLDRYGNPAPNGGVSFTVIEGRATVSSARTTANGEGLASMQLTADAALARGEVIRVAVRSAIWPEILPSQVITLRGA
jgi:hypothetical protein